MKAKLKDSTRFALLLGLLVVGGGVVNVWEWVGEAKVARRALAEMPSQVGPWRQTGPDERFDQATEDVLRADDYLSRVYTGPDGRTASFYVGYYATQRTGATYHSPLNCLPGSGWEMDEAAPVTITPADGSAPFEANRYIVRKGDQSQLLVYWYQGRGRKVSSEYWGKYYTVVDSIRLRRSDGAMVRVMMPVGRDEGATLKAATDLAGQIAPVLPEFVPD
ncbi:MAG TPA: EpsI family protein [Pyrinomonadaceae bacterium]|nr:EpsI family protein [Pyrinomonadaceae bacterium]